MLDRHCRATVGGGVVITRRDDILHHGPPEKSMVDPLNAFCPYLDVAVEGAADGPLAGLNFAAKDLYDIAGYVTGGSNPDWLATHAPATRHAWAVESLLAAGASLDGKTITDELSLGILGENAHYGTPVNPRASGRVPGGSSSGSASAVAAGRVDFALGSDTGGSVRIPASFCGLYGLRTTHGRIPLDGVLEQAPSYDTVGWFARDAETYAEVGAVLLQSEISDGRPTRLFIAEDAFAVADEAVRAALRPAVEMVAGLIGDSRSERLCPGDFTAWRDQQTVLQGREAWQTFGGWIDRTNPRFGFEVARSLALKAAISDDAVAAAEPVRAALIERISGLVEDGGVICLPTAPFVAPPIKQPQSVANQGRPRIRQLTCIAGAAGTPQMSMPVAEVDGLPVGLSLIGARGTDEVLIAFAQTLAAAL